jgi:hypothetical protein
MNWGKKTLDYIKEVKEEGGEGHRNRKETHVNERILPL